jgi:phage replication O-like protein O
VASPQVENGHVKIANELIDAIVRYRLPGEQMQVFLFIMRKTYGWNKKADAISLSQFCEATGMKKPNIIRALKGLISKSVIKKDNDDINKYSINKDFSTWKPLSKKITSHNAVIKKDNEGVSKKITSVIKKDNPSLSKKIPTKDNTTKDTIQKTLLQKTVGKNTFSPPSVNEVEQYCTERNNSVDAVKFIDFYSSKGWMIGKNKMKDWKAAVRTWEARDGTARIRNRSSPLSLKGQINAERIGRWIHEG